MPLPIGLQEHVIVPYLFISYSFLFWSGIREFNPFLLVGSQTCKAPTPNPQMVAIFHQSGATNPIYLLWYSRLDSNQQHSGFKPDDSTRLVYGSMEPTENFEISTSSLQERCSSSELSRHIYIL